VPETTNVRALATPKADKGTFKFKHFSGAFHDHHSYLTRLIMPTQTSRQ